MNSKASQVVQYVLLLSAGIVLSWFFFRTLDLNELKETISTGNFSWFYLVMAVTLIVYIIRVLRWQMLLKATGHDTRFLNTFAALSVSYMVNFVVPRLGEVTRCLSMQKQEKVPFMHSLGTVIIERVVDVISLLLVLTLTIILQFSHIMEFVQVNIFNPFYDGIVLKIMSGNRTTLIVAITVMFLLLLLFVIFRNFIRQRSPKVILKFVQGLKEGIISIAKLERKGLFIFYSVLIWVCYFLMTYFWFFVFEETSILGWGACLSILSIGTIGRSVPIQGGGMGAYHFLVQQVCILYGLGGIFGKTLATLIHAGQTFFTFAMGLVGLVIFFLAYWKKK